MHWAHEHRGQTAPRSCCSWLPRITWKMNNALCSAIPSEYPGAQGGITIRVLLAIWPLGGESQRQGDWVHRTHQAIPEGLSTS